MRLANGIVIDKEKTFGQLKFSALRREVHVQNEDGTISEEIKERTYDLKCREQGRMIQVSVPANIPLRDFEYNAEVELINPVFTTDGENIKVNVSVKYLDNLTKAEQISQYELVVHKDSNWKIVG